MVHRLSSLGDCLSICNQGPGRVLDSEAIAADLRAARPQLASSLRGDASKTARGSYQRASLGLGPRVGARRDEQGRGGSAGTGRGMVETAKISQAWMRLAFIWLPLASSGVPLDSATAACIRYTSCDEHDGESPRRSGSYNGGYGCI